MAIISISSNVERTLTANTSKLPLEQVTFSQEFEADSCDTVVIPSGGSPYNVKPTSIDSLQLVIVSADGPLTLTLGGETSVGKFFIIGGLGTATTITLTNNGVSNVTARVIIAGTRES